MTVARVESTKHNASSTHNTMPGRRGPKAIIVGESQMTLTHFMRPVLRTSTGLRGGVSDASGSQSELPAAASGSSNTPIDLRTPSPRKPKKSSKVSPDSPRKAAPSTTQRRRSARLMNLDDSKEVDATPPRKRRRISPEPIDDTGLRVVCECEESLVREFD